MSIVCRSWIKPITSSIACEVLLHMKLLRAFYQLGLREASTSLLMLNLFIVMPIVMILPQWPCLLNGLDGLPSSSCNLNPSNSFQYYSSILRSHHQWGCWGVKDGCRMLQVSTLGATCQSWCFQMSSKWYCKGRGSQWGLKHPWEEGGGGLLIVASWSCAESRAVWTSPGDKDMSSLGLSYIVDRAFCSWSNWIGSGSNTIFWWSLK